MQWRNIFLSVCLLLITSYAFSQTAQISGIVSDSGTHEALPQATVFINNTTIGSASDLDGKYVLKNIPAGPLEIVVSYVGYETSRTKTMIHDHEQLIFNIKMIPSMVELPKIQITASRDKDWERQYKRFEKAFLGENSTGAKIVNPGIIDFKESDRGKTLSATASEAIQIENPGLGYRIFYYLKKFQSDKQTYAIIGDMRFEELSDDGDKAKRWMRNRKDIYSGSLRHLLVALINHKTDEEGFQLYVDLPGFNANTRSSYFTMNKGVVPFKPDSVVSPGKKAGEFRIEFRQRVEVHYANKIAKMRTYKDISSPVGWIDVTPAAIEVNEDGIIINRADLITSGYLSDARIASLLPLDYKP